jgi:hypothetical protein
MKLNGLRFFTDIESRHVRRLVMPGIPLLKCRAVALNFLIRISGNVMFVDKVQYVVHLGRRDRHRRRARLRKWGRQRGRDRLRRGRARMWIAFLPLFRALLYV